jgi:hypothetical protein
MQYTAVELGLRRLIDVAGLALLYISLLLKGDSFLST